MNKNFVVKSAPLSAATRQRLEADARDIRATATRKQVTLDRYEEASERFAATYQFEIGCWLYHYSRLVGLSGNKGLQARIDCATLLFQADIQNPHYDFFTVFEFGEREFDTIFEMGDSDEVLNGLRERMKSDVTGGIAKAFNHFGWSLEAPSPQIALFA